MTKDKRYKGHEGFKALKTNQENIVIPTDDIIKRKGSNMIVLACISVISNVDNWSVSGNNARYCSVSKIDNNLNSIAQLTGMNRAKIVKELKSLVELNSEEFKLVKREYEGNEVTCAEINYTSGGFVTIDYNILEKLLSYNISLNAFKLYINLLWLCRDNVKKKYVEKQLTQEYLLELIGLSRNSARSIRKAEDELVDLNLIQIKTEWVRNIDDDLNFSNPILKKYYKVVTT